MGILAITIGVASGILLALIVAVAAIKLYVHREQLSSAIRRTNWRPLGSVVAIFLLIGAIVGGVFALGELQKQRAIEQRRALEAERWRELSVRRDAAQQAVSTCHATEEYKQYRRKQLRYEHAQTFPLAGGEIIYPCPEPPAPCRKMPEKPGINPCASVEIQRSLVDQEAGFGSVQGKHPLRFFSR